MVQILVFGDSIAYGAWDKQGGWVQRLRGYLHSKDIDVYNLGVSGDSTVDILHRMETEIKNRIDKNDSLMIIFAIGINDSQFILSKRQFKVTPVAFRNNLLKLAINARKHTPNVVFVGLNPVDESKTVPIPWNTDKSYTNKYVERYNETIKSFCKKRKLHFVDIFNDWSQSNYKNLLDDGLHPNSAGHKKIFESVSGYLEKKKLI